MIGIFLDDDDKAQAVKIWHDMVAPVWIDTSEDAWEDMLNRMLMSLGAFHMVLEQRRYRKLQMVLAAVWPEDWP